MRAFAVVSELLSEAVELFLDVEAANEMVAAVADDDAALAALLRVVEVELAGPLEPALN